MKQRFNKIWKVVKGMPSAVLLSFVIHAALFLLAGMLVVFTVVKKEDKKFIPPKVVDRPKMNLRKPKVKVKKTSQPKPTTRIVTKINRASMPDIQLPEMSGIGEGLAGVIGGFDVLPDFGEVSVFGSGQTVGNDFVGTFYDFNRDRRGRPITMDPTMIRAKVRHFVANGWKTSEFSRYYRSPKKLYTTTFMVPPVVSTVAPAAFGEVDTAGYCWLVHYKGELVHKDGITFRFWGNADDMLVVRVDGKIVLSNGADMGNWQSSSAKSKQYFLGHWKAIVGDWITLEPGVPLEMEVLFGEQPGGWFYAMLLVEEEGREYPINYCNGPILPMFKTMEPSLDLIEKIHGDLVPGEACVTNGPVFCDYGASVATSAGDSVDTELPSVESGSLADEFEGRTRTWIRMDGKTLKAEFVTTIGDKAVLKDSRGKQLKVPLSQLSMEDRTFVELAQSPKFNIDFSKQSSKQSLEPSPWIQWELPRILDYVFSARLKQVSAGEYNHELKVEFFAVGEEIDGDNYILLDRQESRFTPTKENERSHTFSGKTVTLMDINHINNQRRGEKYGGYLVVVTDSRGKIIDHGTSHKWLFENFEKLRKFPLGKHFDKTCTRVAPPRPVPSFVPYEQ